MSPHFIALGPQADTAKTLVKSVMAAETHFLSSVVGSAYICEPVTEPLGVVLKD